MTAALPDLLPDFLVTARSLAEYLAMFDLDPADLRGRDVLDCPGGAASFTAEACLAGARATAVDPAYAMGPGELAVRALDDIGAGKQWLVEHADAYDWSAYGGSVESHSAHRTAAAGRFSWDLRAHPERYAAGALPDLPVAAGSADLVLSSHLLFCYADRLDEAFHLRALRELLRVCRPGGEVRIFPLVDYAGHTPVFRTRLLAELTGLGMQVMVRESPYRFQRSATELLVLRKPADDPHRPAG